MIVALAVGIPLILPCLCLVGTTAAVLSSSLVVKRKRGKINGVGNFLLLTYTIILTQICVHNSSKGSSKQEDKQR